MKPTRWSYSSLSTYEECPAKWKYAYIDRLPDPPSPAMERGTRLHKMCESVLTEGVQTPPELANIGRVLERLKANQAQAERAWRLNSEWVPVAEKSWLIGIIDVHFTRDGALHVYDFKSGKPYTSHKKQLELYALIGLATYPQAERAECGAIYIDTGKIGYRRTVTREEAQVARVNWTARANAMFADEKLAPRRGSGCYWCAFKDSLGGPCSAWRENNRQTALDSAAELV